ncbi:MAG: hypothetical protein MZV70_21435 [Desulfobacterales bacterium]|nr:hypothetical protein [Desulfobacterales bacterium]
MRGKAGNENGDPCKRSRPARLASCKFLSEIPIGTPCQVERREQAQAARIKPPAGNAPSARQAEQAEQTKEAKSNGRVNDMPFVYTAPILGGQGQADQSDRAGQQHRRKCVDLQGDALRDK